MQNATNKSKRKEVGHNGGNPLPKAGEGFSVQRLGGGRAEPFCGWASILHKNLCKTLCNLPIAFIPKV